MVINTLVTNDGPHELGSGSNNGLVIQNQGPGDVAWSKSADVHVANGPGIVLEPGQGFEFPEGQHLYLYVTANQDATDLRVESI